VALNNDDNLLRLTFKILSRLKKGSKFPTKHVYKFLSHLKHVATLPGEMQTFNNDTNIVISHYVDVKKLNFTLSLFTNSLATRSEINRKTSYYNKTCHHNIQN